MQNVRPLYHLRSRLENPSIWLQCREQSWDLRSFGHRSIRIRRSDIPDRHCHKLVKEDEDV